MERRPAHEPVSHRASGRACSPLSVGLVGVVVAAVALAASVQAAVRVVGADEVQRLYCREHGGRLWFEAPGLAPQELVTSVNDPAIANRGDGSFHPFDPATVASALAQLRYEVESVDAVAYALPFPRRAGLESAAAPGVILLSPGTRPVSESMTHQVVAHEFGHVVQYALAPRGGALWQQYLDLRGLDGTRDTDATPHAERPREIFAEDFRALFGSDLARGDGAIENPNLVRPAEVPGLSGFVAGLPAQARRDAASAHGVAAYPNPFAGSTRLTVRAHAGAATSTAALAPAGWATAGNPGAAGSRAGVREFRVVDVRGRVVRREQVSMAGDGSASWVWDGTGDGGLRLAPGAYFVVAQGETGGATRIVLTR